LGIPDSFNLEIRLATKRVRVISVAIFVVRQPSNWSECRQESPYPLDEIVRALGLANQFAVVKERGQMEPLAIEESDSLLGAHPLGYDVLIAGSGCERIKIIASHPFDAVILDYNMPETNGGMVASTIKRIRCRLPIIMVSGAVSVPKKVLESVDAFIAKGQSPALLLRKMQELLVRSA
jgi:CheY-like chemotaxis protein